MPSTQPKVTGTYLKTEMLRVDHDFAQMVREIARTFSLTVTEVTRTMYLNDTETPAKRREPASKRSTTKEAPKVATPTS